MTDEDTNGNDGCGCIMIAIIFLILVLGPCDSVDRLERKLNDQEHKIRMLEIDKDGLKSDVRSLESRIYSLEKKK